MALKLPHATGWIAEQQSIAFLSCQLPLAGNWVPSGNASPAANAAGLGLQEAALIRLAGETIRRLLLQPVAAKYWAWAKAAEYTHSRVGTIVHEREKRFLNDTEWEDIEAKIMRRMRY
jgi:hypothetical protein